MLVGYEAYVQVFEIKFRHKYMLRSYQRVCFYLFNFSSQHPPAPNPNLNIQMCSAGDKTGMSSQAMLATLATILCIFWLLWEFKKMMSRNYHLPPGPRGLPLVGYLPFLGKNLHQSFNELARIYGPIYKLNIGHKQCVIISSPSLVKEVHGRRP